MEPTFPNVHIQLSGRDGNAFAIVGRVNRALKAAGIGRDEINEFTEAAMNSGSYDDLLRLAMSTVEVS